MTAPAWMRRDVALASLVTIGTGGPARYVADAHDAAAVAEALRFAADEGLAVSVVGAGSNLLPPDAGFDGLVLRLKGALAEVEVDGDLVICGGGASLPKAARRAARAGLADLEWGVQVPGTVGGAVRMNAGCYGGDVAGSLAWAELAGEGARRAGDELDFAYRHSNVAAGQVVTRAAFRLPRGDPDRVRARLEELRQIRIATQPRGVRTFGSTFKNPPDRAETAGVLLDRAGAKGLRSGGAHLSEVHANFVENDRHATTADVATLIDLARARVHDAFGVTLETEVIRSLTASPR